VDGVSVVEEQDHSESEELQYKKRQDARKDKIALIPAKGPRGKAKLQNLDGTEMSVADYLDMVRSIQRGEPTAILNFGLANSKWVELKETEGTEKQVKKRDYMFEIENSKRLLPSSC
jgi:hypothetical protein